jgi:hypothetical protein
MSEAAEISVIPKLLETQDKFISILKLSGKDPEKIFDVIEAGDLPANIFLKHLVVLADYGGEPLKRLGKEFKNIFPEINGKRIFEFSFKGKKNKYYFKALPVNSLSNTKLSIDGSSIIREKKLDDLTKDIIMLMLYGGASDVSDQAGLERCEIGGLLGNPIAIDTYVKQKYICVSRITTGASANSLGQIAQIYVANYLSSHLDNTYTVQSNGKIKLNTYDSKFGMPFDVVVKRGHIQIGIEVSFQVTSNSVIERKAALAEDRLNQMRKAGYYIAYVLDGAGNFSRTSALTTLCQSSDCTVAYSDSELNTLLDFIKGKLDDSIR